jgi:hypothetical protein
MRPQASVEHSPENRGMVVYPAARGEPGDLGENVSPGTSRPAYRRCPAPPIGARLPAWTGARSLR